MISFLDDESWSASGLLLKLSEKLELHCVFVKTILRVLTLPLVGEKRKHNTSCPLTILSNQGGDTLLEYKQQLAGYLDIPTGKDLWVYRRAFCRLDSMGNIAVDRDLSIVRASLKESTV